MWKMTWLSGWMVVSNRAGEPAVVVVGVAQVCGPATAECGADPLGEDEAEALSAVEEPCGAAEVEEFRPAAQDGGDQACLARHSPGEGRGHGFAGLEDRAADVALQPGVVDQHHDGGVDPAELREPVGGEPFDELAERVAQALR
ncbi:hypothetical protein [Nocardioides deserti]|uniref:Uncharacterized protein n=1 Tax=Nocardioides deserti TaxID=1588644 RepID=A0ABR6U9J0_9ACTN|nr:hypothetical protein [Nocardioides deserti]MBC2960609.1 hypothetical protein [Nocardioides deserti]GGO70879.1 hypothetical protein GCM10012276_10480 [Nocardioides deserti]